MDVTHAEQQAVIERFLRAITSGDLQGLLDVLAPDVTLVADGGGVVGASRVPITGAETIARALARLAARAPEGFTLAPMRINGAPAARFDVDGALDTAVSFVVEKGRITRIFAVRNPQKLSGLRMEAEVARG